MKKKLGSCAACLSCKGDSVLLHPRGAGSLSRTQNGAFNTRSTACFVSRATLWPATKRRNISSFRNILSAGPSYQPQKQRKLPFALPGPEAISPRGLYVNDPTESGGEESLQKALEAVVFDDSASMKVREVIRKAISEELRIPNRDLRNVDNSFQNQMACFLVRDKAIIINLEHIKAIIQHDKVYIFNIKNASLDHFFPTFQHRLKPLDGSSSQPFEFRAVEAILSAVNESLYADYWDMKMRIDSLISDIEKKDESELILKSLLDFNKKLNNFQKRVKEVQTAITMVLNSDEDLAAMYLTCKARTGHPRRIDQHEEAEMLLETYLGQVGDIGNEVTEMQTIIGATEEHIKLTLDSQRNKIMRMNLFMTMATASLAGGSLVTGAFGMNLSNHLEDHPSAFLFTSSCVGFGSFATFLACYAFCKRKGML